MKGAMIYHDITGTSVRFDSFGNVRHYKNVSRSSVQRLNVVIWPMIRDGAAALRPVLTGNVGWVARIK